MSKPTELTTNELIRWLRACSDTCMPSQTQRYLDCANALTERDARIAELEAENARLKTKLCLATEAICFVGHEFTWGDGNGCPHCLATERAENARLRARERKGLEAAFIRAWCLRSGESDRLTSGANLDYEIDSLVRQLDAEEESR